MGIPRTRGSLSLSAPPHRKARVAVYAAVCVAVYVAVCFAVGYSGLQWVAMCVDVLSTST